MVILEVWNCISLQLNMATVGSLYFQAERLWFEFVYEHESC